MQYWIAGFIAALVILSPVRLVAHAEDVAGTVRRVVDGDTVDVVTASGKVERVRIIGLDTPEVLDPRKPVQCFGRQASDRAKELLAVGSAVTLQGDPTQDARDRFGRILAHVLVDAADGGSPNFAVRMIADGFAHHYVFRVPSTWAGELTAAQKDAEANGRGLWSTETCGGQAYPKHDLEDDGEPPGSLAVLVGSDDKSTAIDGGRSAAGECGTPEGPAERELVAGADVADFSSLANDLEEVDCGGSHQPTQLVPTPNEELLTPGTNSHLDILASPLKIEPESLRPTATHVLVTTVTRGVPPSATRVPQPTGTPIPQPTATKLVLPTATQMPLPTATAVRMMLPSPVPTAVRPSTQSQVEGPFNGWSGTTMVKLRNGQAWEQAEYVYDYWYAYEPKVSIFEAQGSSLMLVEGGTRAVGVRQVSILSESRVDGPFAGWNGSTIVKLINGEYWQQTDSHVSVLATAAPAVYVFQSRSGLKMYVSGTSTPVAVQRFSPPTSAAMTSPVQSSIAGAFNGWSGSTFFKLANGQLWQQAEYAYYFYYAFNPRVVIYQSDLRWVMKVDGVGPTLVVKRIS